MSKFSKGDKARVMSVNALDVQAGVKVGDIVTVNEDNSCAPYCVMSNGRVRAFLYNQIEHYIETPKEITLNGATYILKEEPKPEHEWKFGDIAVHDEYGIGIVVMTDNEDGDFYFAQSGDNEQRIKWVVERDLTFIRRADLSV